MKLLKALQYVILRDLTLYIRRRGEWMMPVIYFIMIATLFPLTIDSEPTLLAKLAPGIIWVSVVLSLLMSLENIFRLDYQEGSLEQFILSPYPLPVILFGKSIAHWLAIGVPLLVLVPFVGLLLHLSTASIWVLEMSLLIGIPLISLIGSIGVALSIGLHRGGLLLAVLVLPLMMPVIIFGASSITKAEMGLPYYPELLLLAAMLILACCMVPVVISMAVKVSLD